MRTADEMDDKKRIEELEGLVLAYRSNLENVMTYQSAGKIFTALHGDSEVTDTVNILGEKADKILTKR